MIKWMLQVISDHCALWTGCGQDVESMWTCGLDEVCSYTDHDIHCNKHCYFIHLIRVHLLAAINFSEV